MSSLLLDAFKSMTCMNSEEVSTSLLGTKPTLHCKTEMKPIESPWKKQRNKVLHPKRYGYKNDAYFLISSWTL